MLSLPVFLRVFFLRALCCVFLRSLVPAGNQAGAGAGLPGSSRYAPAHGIAVVRKVCPVRIFYKGQNENSKSVEIGKAVKMQ